MKTKLFTALLTMLACGSFSHAQSYFDYTSYKYSWGGKSVSVTEPVTDPGQMVELQKKLMQTKAIPGTIDVDGIPEHNVNYLNTSNNVNYTPNKDGFTCLLYTLKPNVNKETTPNEPKTKEEFEKTVNSIQLITNTTECKDAYILSFSGNYDRFYFASKGKPRWNDPLNNGNKAPSPCDWELFSPTGNAAYVSNEEGFDRTHDFYNTLMVDGGMYKISHDCSNVGGQKHYFEINANGTDRELKNVALMVPKNRMNDWDGSDFTPAFMWPDSKTGNARDANGMFTWYHPDFCPRLAVYKASLTAKATKSETYNEFTDEGRMYNVRLEWESTLKDPNSLNWPGGETFKVYRINADKTETLIHTTEDRLWFNDRVFQTNESYDLKYKVVCFPTGTNPNDPVQAISNEASVLIPGYIEMRTDFSYRSRFEVKSHKNSYKNTLELYPGDETGYYEIFCTPTKLDQIAASDADRTSVARVSVDLRDVRQGSYEVEYNGPMREDEDCRFDSEPLTEHGQLSGHPDELITINDYFLESTELKKEERVAYYTYSISKYNPNNNTWSTPKDFAVIPVYSGIIDPVYGPSYSYEQIKADMKKKNNDTRLAPTSQATIAVSHFLNQGIRENEWKTVGYDFYEGTELSYKDKQSINVSVPRNAGKYTGQIRIDSPWGVNTYGTAEVDIAKIQAELKAIKRGWQWFGTDKMQKVFLAELEILPKLNGKIPRSNALTTSGSEKATPFVYYYSLTRCNDTDEPFDDSFWVHLNALEDQSGAGWATNYASIKQTYPIGKSQEQELYISDIWVADDDRPGEDICDQLGFNLRMYYTPEYTTGTPNKLQRFYIIEDDCFFDMVGTNSVITGVNDVNVDKSVVDVKYYNLMGVCSDKPFDGANIKVERHADGTTTSTKMMK